MSSKALDVVTIGHALNELCSSYLGEDCQWRGITDEQRDFLAWYESHRSELGQLSSLEALASTDYTVLNSFLEAHGFTPMFNPFNGFGVASILDMLVEWLHKGDLTTVSRFDNEASRSVDYPAFKVPDEGAELFSVVGFDQPLVRLLTRTGHSLWLMKADEPASGIGLATMAQQILMADREPNRRWAGIKVPMLEMDLKPDLAWMLNMEADSSVHGVQCIEQAFQQFKLRANEKGARVKVATGIAMRGVSLQPSPYSFNDPFIGFFTQPGHEALAMAAFWADTDTWRNPEGTLEEL